MIRITKKIISQSVTSRQKGSWRFDYNGVCDWKRNSTGNLQSEWKLEQKRWEW